MNQYIDFDEGWGKIHQAISTLLDYLDGNNKQRKFFSNKQYAETYTVCYNMCTAPSIHDFSSRLYEKYKLTFETYLQDVVLRSLEKKMGKAILEELVWRWENHAIMSKWMRKFFMYLDRYHVKHHNQTPLDKLALELFREKVFLKLQDVFTNAILEMINQEREGGVVDRDLLWQCIHIFTAIDTEGTVGDAYQQFQEKLITDTERFYANKSQELFENNSVADYLKIVEKVLEDEKKRVQNYLNPCTTAPLLNVCHEEFLKRYQMEILSKEGNGFTALLANDKLDDIERMFILYEQIQNGIDPMADKFRQYIETEGNEMMQMYESKADEENKEMNNSNPIFIEDIMTFHDKFSAIVTQRFKSNSLFQKALTDAFIEIMNHNENIKLTEVLSSYCDRLLKTGGVKLSDEEIDVKLEKAVQLFSYLTEKDAFAELYRNQLAKRILDDRSANPDSERLVIGKLKLRCGTQFTSKMEGMMSDITIARTIKATFSDHLKAKQIQLPIRDFSVEILTTGYWPTYQTFELNLPPDMLFCTQVFHQFFKETSTHKRIRWIFSLGNASIGAIFDKKQFEFQVVTLQAIVLLLFNNASESASINFSTIQSGLNIPEETLKRVLHSLACGKLKVLNKNPPGKSVKPTDDFSINTSFSCPMRKVRIPMPNLESSSTQKKVEEDRSVAIEASIVRIMKARRKLSHQQLINEVVSQLSFFKPNAKTIKQRIEALIEREYLERDPNVPNSYIYLA